MTLTKAQKVVLLGTLLLLVVLIAIPLIVYRSQIADHFTQTSAKRAIENHTLATVDLAANYLMPNAVFDSASYWGDVPHGFQVFNHVPFRIEGVVCLWGEGNTKMGAVYPEEVLGIPVKQKFETLYIYHATFFSDADGTPVYEVVFRYQDGSSATNQLLYGQDMLDFVVKNSRHPKGPTGPNTKIAWTGATFTPDQDNPLRFNTTAVKNPQPSLEVTTIDFYSCKKRPAACILAMTVGKSGQMR